MQDLNDQATDLSLETEGSAPTEEQVHELEARPAIDFPMEGEVAHPEGPGAQTLAQIEENERAAQD
jgi:hypothetical protein